MAKGKKTGGRDFKPGVSGNPGGAIKLPEDIKQARKLTRVELERILNRFVYMTKQEIIDIARDPKTTGLELMIASLVSKATNEGDYKRISFILDRLGFIVAQKMEHSGDIGNPRVVVTVPSNGREATKKKVNGK
jgi:hypothetical protein